MKRRTIKEIEAIDSGKRAFLKKQWKIENELINSGRGVTTRDQSQARIAREWENRKWKKYLKVVKVLKN